MNKENEISTRICDFNKFLGVSATTWRVPFVLWDVLPRSYPVGVKKDGSSGSTSSATNPGQQRLRLDAMWLDMDLSGYGFSGRDSSRHIYWPLNTGHPMLIFKLSAPGGDEGGRPPLTVYRVFHSLPGLFSLRDWLAVDGLRSETKKRVVKKIKMMLSSRTVGTELVVVTGRSLLFCGGGAGTICPGVLTRSWTWDGN